MREATADAIKNRRRISIFYSPGLRQIEPHALGWSAAGDLLLRAFQTEGASASGEHSHWKLFRVDRCESEEVLADTFDGPRDGYRKDDKAMKGGIIAQV